MVEIAVPASSAGAERAVLGAMLISGEAARKARLAVEESDFDHDSHRAIFRAVCAILDAGAIPDSVLVSERLNRIGKLGDVGGYAYLLDCIHGLSTADHVEQYAEIVKRAALDRAVKTQIRVTAADDTPDNASKLFDLMLARQGLGAKRMLDFREGLAEAVDELLKRRVRGVSTMYPNLDANIPTGLMPGDLVTIGARPGGGKTALKTKMAVNIAGEGIKVAYITTEMSREEMLTRVLPAGTGVPAWKFMVRDKSGSTILSPTELQNIMRAVRDRYSKYPLMIADISRPSLSDIQAVAMRSECRVLFVDYLQRCRYPVGQSRTYEIQEFLTGLKTFAMDAKISVVISGQLDRQRDKAGDAQPTLSDFKDSGAIDAESDAALLLWFQEHPENEVKDGIPMPRDGRKAMNCLHAKNRKGPVGVISYLELDGPMVDIAARMEERAIESDDKEQW